MAITVPREERRILPEVTPNVQMQTDNISTVSEMVGEPPVTAFEDKVTPVAEKLINDQINRIDDAVGMDNAVRLAIEADTIQNSVTQKFRGKDAAAATDEARKLWNDSIQRIGKDGVKTRRQEELFNKSVLNNSLKLEANMANHTARETEAYENQAYDSWKAMKIDVASKYENMRLATMKEIEDKIRETGKNRGWATDYIEGQIKTTNAVIVENAVREDEINYNPEGALKTFNLFQEHIPEKDRLRIKERLEFFVNMQQGAEIGKEIYNSNPDALPTEMYAKVEEKTGRNERKKKAAISEIDRMRDAKDKDEKIVKENAWLKIETEITKQRIAGKIPSLNAMDLAIVKAAYDTDPKRLGDYLAAWDRERSSARSEREIKKEQAKNAYETAVLLDNTDPIYWPKAADIDGMVARGEITPQDGQKFSKRITSPDPQQSIIFNNASKRLEKAFETKKKNIDANDEEAMAKFEEEKEFYRNRLSNLSKNYAIGDKAEYEKRLDEFIKNAVVKYETDTIGWILDKIPFSGSPYGKVTEMQKTEQRREAEKLAGPDRGLTLGGSGVRPLSGGKKAGSRITVLSPPDKNGKRRKGTIPAEQLSDALASGYEVVK